MLKNENGTEQIPAVLSAQLCGASSSLGVHEGEAIHSVGDGEDISEKYHLLFLFFFLVQGGKTP